MLLTHAHIDHAGLLPKLVKHGFEGRIHCTAATVDLCGIMLPDSGDIQEMEVEQLNRRRVKRGQEEVEPIYTLDDAMAALEHFEGHAYETWITPAPGIRARFWNAGHLLGSASIEVEVEQPGDKPLRLLFSGDIGPDNKMLHPDPEAPTGFDFVVCESTYGGRDRFERSEDGRREILAARSLPPPPKQGALLIPSFAVERTQELVTDLVKLMDEGKVPKANIFIDSPLASKATAIFARHAGELQHGDDLTRPSPRPCASDRERGGLRRRSARFSGFRIIVSAQRHVRGGPHPPPSQEPSLAALHHGPARGLPGGRLARPHPAGRRQDRHHHGRDDQREGDIRQIEDYSGHADGPELVQWVKERLPIGRSIFLTHGEEEGQRALAEDLDGLGIPQDCILIPSLDSVYELSGEACAYLAAETQAAHRSHPGGPLRQPQRHGRPHPRHP